MRVSALGWVLAMDAQQFRFSSLAPWVERGLPWSLPRPFCLSPGFSLPVDPYRTGEFHLAVCVTPQIFVGSGATHTTPGFVSTIFVGSGATHTTPDFVSQGEVLRISFSVITKLALWAGYFTVHADQLGTGRPTGRPTQVDRTHPKSNSKPPHFARRKVLPLALPQTQIFLQLHTYVF